MQRPQWLSTSLDTDNSSSLRRPPSGQRRGTARRCPRRTLALVTTMALAVALAVLPPAAMAALQITGVHVDTNTNTIMIMGQDFTGPGLLGVTLGDATITTQCQVSSATMIICTFSGGLPPAGDYRLTVARGSGSSGYNYDLTIGAVGAVGPQGPIGLTGPAGPAGQTPNFVTQQCLSGTNPCPCNPGKLISGGAECPTFTFLSKSVRAALDPNAWDAQCCERPPEGTNDVYLCYNATRISLLCCTNCP
jgi:hypothetical protein